MFSDSFWNWVTYVMAAQCFLLRDCSPYNKLWPFVQSCERNPPFYVQVLCAASILSSLYNCSLLFEKVAFLRKKKDFLWTCSLDFYEFELIFSTLTQDYQNLYVYSILLSLEFLVLPHHWCLNWCPTLGNLWIHLLELGIFFFFCLSLYIPSEKSVQL